MDYHGENELEIQRSVHGKGETFATIMERRLSRRTFLKGSVAASTVVMAASAMPQLTGSVAKAQTAGSSINFEAIEPQDASVDEVATPADYNTSVLLRWGDPITADAPEFDVDNQTAAAQEQQFGYNCDFVGFLPLPFGSDASDRGLLAVNHEYTNPDIMFSDYNPDEPTKDHVDVELAAHGLSVVEIERDGDGVWQVNRGSELNRRYTAMSPMTISGPAADHEWLQTADDPSGQNILGTLNNCAGGKTPWGTVVTAEENFHQYFGNQAQMADDDPRKEVHARYGLPEESSSRRWEDHYTRFDLSQEPNEPFRFGWAVEYDPYDPAMTPVKRTSIGRYRHEAQTFIVAPGGQVAVYSGDDARFEYVYKFVTSGTYNSGDRAANMGLLDEGTLYVARFNEDGSGDWLPLIYGEGPLTEENGFTSQGDVLVKTRLAGDLLGATQMDRPEDIEPNPVNQKVYIVLTKNARRGVDDNPGTNAANPRAENEGGHIIELTEDGDDHTSTTFSWDIFLLCGDPDDESTFFAGFPKDQVSPIAAPDNVTFDNAGNLWIATDGQPSALEYNDALFAVPVEGEERGFVRQFFSSVAGSEVCGPEFTPDNTSLFLAIQHPGEDGSFDEPQSTWPDGETPPRPSLVVVQAGDGSPVGTVSAAAAGDAAATGDAAAPAEGDAATGDAAAPAEGDAATGDAAAPADGDGDSPASLPETGGNGFNAGPVLVATGLGAALGGALLRRRSKLQAEQNGENGSDSEQTAQDEQQNDKQA
jgi:hypothetical protein